MLSCKNTGLPFDDVVDRFLSFFHYLLKRLKNNQKKLKNPSTL